MEPFSAPVALLEGAVPRKSPRLWDGRSASKQPLNPNHQTLKLVSRHWPCLYFAGCCNQILWWAFVKAAYRAFITRVCGGNIVFKATAKGQQLLWCMVLKL